jgi:phosphonate transport system substrate-binding protein
MSNTPTTPAPSFSFGRVLLLAVPLAILIWGANRMYSGSVQQDADKQLQRNTFSGLLGGQAEGARLDKSYADADGDMLADAPTDAADLKDPAELNFSYVASSEAEGEDATWKELLAAIGKATGKKVNLVSYADSAEQTRALQGGDLHITAFSTGEAEGAVNEAGFIPVACFADANGDYRITMKLIVPADSPIKKIDDLRPAEVGGELKKHRVTFVRPRSNTGCTAALVMLADKHDLHPERDYNWGFSYGHENSIHGIVDKRYEVAAVASDILDRLIASGDVAQDAIREIYESEPFPPGVIGYAHNLTPELRDGIRQALLDFSWVGTGLEKSYGASGAVKFAPVDYKKDWEGVREVRAGGSKMLDELAAN